MKRLLQSFGHAIDGLKILIQQEPNYLIHLSFTILVLGLGHYLNLSKSEWGLVIISISLVLITETINTSIENVMDFISIKRDQHIKKIKDLAAAAVLLSVLAAIGVGSIVFIPKLAALLF